jgi:sarcosine oxidase delta subunit
MSDFVCPHCRPRRPKRLRREAKGNDNPHRPHPCEESVVDS